MAKQIFVNLPIKDMERSKNFFTGLGFSFDPQFTNDKGACMIIGPNIYAMLLVESFFQTFTKKEIIDSSKSTEVIIAISVESRAKVTEMVDTALKAGGSISSDPQDYGWMYARSFQDPDGHIWEVLYTDPSGPPKA
jgi:predicted lactoylglutathione lyase